MGYVQPKGLMMKLHTTILVMLLGLMWEAIRIETVAKEVTLPSSKRSTDQLMPEDILLDNIQDDQERLLMETQLNQLREA